MIKQFFSAAVLTGFLGALNAHATTAITNVWSMGGGGGVSADLVQQGGLNTDSYWIHVTGGQAANGWLGWGLATDNANDPTLTLNNSLENDSSFAWSEYLVTVTMNKPFAFTNTPTVNIPGDWTVNVTTPSGPDGFGNYVGTLDLLGGTPVNIGDTLDYTYKVFFSGSTSYSITEQVAAVPEPSTLGLIALGGLFLARRRTQK